MRLASVRALPRRTTRRRPPHAEPRERVPARARVAYFSPLPPERTGISEYSALLLSALRERLDVQVVPRGSTAPRGADVCLYHIGNNPDAHSWIVEALRARPGVVVLHDFVLHHLVAGMTLGRGDRDGYLDAMQHEAGVPGRLLAHGVVDGLVPPLWEAQPEAFPLVGEVLELAARPGGGLIVHSQYVERLARQWGYDGQLWSIPHPAWPQPRVDPVRVDGSPVIGCFGHLTAQKRIPQLVSAFARLRRRHPNARLLLVGSAAPGFELETSLAADLEGVIREDYVEEEQLWALMSACDVLVTLRTPTMGETSGSAIRGLVAGRPLVVSDVGWFSELPDEVALKVPADETEVGLLSAALELLAASPEARAAMATAARAYVRREHGLDRVAAAYATALEQATAGESLPELALAGLARRAAAVAAELAPTTEAAVAG
jgi:glycosyltransferase involved in cell wall biosynthesis